ncbi:hypothetical protein OHA57_39415 (plasmid) [Streptomyces anulatus]|uniref:hypothetical protein n=1 Tax=Streptomyces TaxID=1883 RepID=UPI000BFE1CA3|nr:MULTISPECIES: hypothetical protein [Streptomyces]WSC66832.1 hypothetical protein OHA57_39415 [Streptomyces anulatus]
MPPQQSDSTDAEGRIGHAVAELTAVFENLGPEYQALSAEESRTSARERRGTVVRMGENVAQAARTVAATIGVLATVHGLRALGIDQQFSKDAEGCDYSPLGTLDSPSEALHDAVTYLEEAAATLGKAYAPTKKNPGLAVARCPQQMKAALSSLRAALTMVWADAPEDDMDVEEQASVQTLLTELEQRVCRTVPAQGAGPSPEEVAAAIRADPQVARAAAAALAANA